MSIYYLQNQNKGWNITAIYNVSLATPKDTFKLCETYNVCMYVRTLGIFCHYDSIFEWVRQNLTFSVISLYRKH